MYQLMTSFIGSPKQEHKAEIEKTVNNIDEFPEYFNDLFSKENNGDATAKSKIENINIRKILTPESISHKPPANKEVFAYLFNNFRNKFNEKLEKPNGTIEKFIPAKSFEFSYNRSKKEDREFLADCLRNDITIEKILLKYCDFDDVDARYFANIFWYNDKIRHFSLADNEKITAFGIKTLLNIKEYNKVLQELLVYLPGQYENLMDFHYTENATDKIEIKISSSKEINIFDKEAINAYLKKLQEKN